MRKQVFLFLFVLAASFSYGQDREADFRTITRTEQTEDESSGGFFRGLLSVYNKHISDQILNDCIYEHSCSTFSQGAFSHFGIVKGYFITVDRLSRCNRASLIQVAPVRINEEGKIRDHWTDYTFTN